MALSVREREGGEGGVRGGSDERERGRERGEREREKMGLQKLYR